MTMEFLIGLIILLLDIVAVVSVLQSFASIPAKVLWALLILILPGSGLDPLATACSKKACPGVGRSHRTKRLACEFGGAT